MNLLTKQIAKVERVEGILLSVFVAGVYVFGHYFYPKSIYQAIPVGIFLGLVASLVIFKLEKYRRKIQNCEKGKRGEDFVESILKQIPGVKYERNKKMGFRDLDFLVFTPQKTYGLEVKNYSGVIEYDSSDEKILVNRYPENILNTLKNTCGKVQKQIVIKNPHITWVEPIVVFCDESAYIKIPIRKVKSGKQEILVIKPSDLRDLLKI